MTKEQTLIKLGFTKEAVPPGTHICHIFREDEERSQALKAFLLAGLQGGEGVGCFLAEKAEPLGLGALLKERALDLEALKTEGRFLLMASREVYFKDGRFAGRFDPGQPFGLFSRLQEEAMEAGRTVRLMGEMSPEVGQVDGGQPLVRYEHDLNLFLQQKRMTIVCQYEAAAFHGAVIMDVLKVHPMMVAGGEVIHNPFYVPPEGPPVS